MTLKVGLIFHRGIGVWIFGNSEHKPTTAMVLVARKLPHEDEEIEGTESAILFYFLVIQTTHEVAFIFI